MPAENRAYKRQTWEHMALNLNMYSVQWCKVGQISPKEVVQNLKKRTVFVPIKEESALCEV